MKLVAREPETSALVESIRGRAAIVSSALSRVEVVRAVRRIEASGEREGRANDLIDRIALIPIDDGIVIRAARLEPTALRTLDEIHLGDCCLARIRPLRPDHVRREACRGRSN